MSSESGSSSPAKPDGADSPGTAASDSPEVASPATQEPSAVPKAGAASAKRGATRDAEFPTRGQLAIVAAMVGVTFLGWGSAKLVCNYHPFESHKPAPVTMDQLARDPKHAAIEFEHRLAICDFEGALGLTTGPLVEEVNRTRAAASSERCDERRRLAPRVFTYAELLTKEPEAATARVHSQFNDAKETSVVELAAQGGLWKVKTRRTE